MFHDLGAGDRAIFVDMTDNKHRNLLLFGNCQQTSRAFLDLTDRTGRGRNIHAAHGLDGVDDDQFRLFLFDQSTDLIHVIFCGQIDILLRDFEPCGAQFDLTHRLFTGDIQNCVLVRNCTAQLQQHRRFANARFAAQKHHAAQNDAAAQNAVQLRNTCQDAALLLGRADIRQPPCRQRGDALLPHGSRRFSARKPRFGGFGHDIFVHGVPASAAGAAAHPARAGLAAVRADINGFQFRFSHIRSYGCRREAALISFVPFYITTSGNSPQEILLDFHDGNILRRDIALAENDVPNLRHLCRRQRVPRGHNGQVCPPRLQKAKTICKALCFD